MLTEWLSYLNTGVSTMKIKTARVAAVSALFALFSVIGNATVITSTTNNPLLFNWSYSSTAGNLTGNGSLALSGFNTTTLIVDVILNNTSGLSTNRLTSFGFGIDPNATSVTFSDPGDTTGMVGAALNNIPSLAAIEVCAYGGNNCSGGSNGGILGGLSDSFRLSLLNETITTTGNGNNRTTTRTPNLWGNSVDISPIGFKYQTGSGSFEFTTSSSSSGTSGQTSSGGNIPEPGILALLSAGLLGQALLIRQRRRRQK